MVQRKPISEDQKYVSVSIHSDLMRRVDDLIETGTHGYDSRAEVIKDALRRLFQELEKAEEMPPRIEHVNVFEDHAVLRDNMLKRTVFVYSRNGALSCDLCESANCIHTRYTETLQLGESS